PWSLSGKPGATLVYRSRVPVFRRGSWPRGPMIPAKCPKDLEKNGVFTGQFGIYGLSFALCSSGKHSAEASESPSGLQESTLNLLQIICRDAANRSPPSVESQVDSLLL